MKTSFLLPAVALLTACAANAGMKTDIEFARPGGFSLTLDAWTPEGKGPFPTVIIVHGGAFSRGDKQTYVKPLFPVLTEAGFAWFTINYRLAPQYHFPDPVQDVEAAIRWVKQHASEYKVDVKRITLTGESAGGHLVAYVGTTSAARLGVKAVVPFYAPDDLAGRAQKQGTINEAITGFLNVRPELTSESLRILEQASPINHVNGHMPPFLLIHGTADKLVPYEQSVEMQKKIRAAGGACDLFTIPNGEHGMGSWEKLPDGLAYQKYLVDWLRKTLR